MRFMYVSMYIYSGYETVEEDLCASEGASRDQLPGAADWSPGQHSEAIVSQHGSEDSHTRER